MPARLFARFLLHLRDLLAAQVAGWFHALRRRGTEAWAARPGGAQALAIGLALALAVGSLAAAGAPRLRRAAHADAQVLGGLEVTRFDLREPVLPVTVLAERAPDLVELREAGGQPRTCLVLRPVPGAALVRRLPAVPLGRLLAGHATLLPGPGRAPVRVALEVDGQELGALELDPGDGRRAFELDTASLAGTSHEVTLVAGSADELPRAVCLEVLALP
jgi:hypothetical protein